MKKHGEITAFYLETLLLILVFVAILLVLTQVFGLGRMQSAEARSLTDAVSLAQNTAEAFAAAESPEELLRLLDAEGCASLLPDTAGVEARYDAALRPAADGCYLVQTLWLSEPDESGVLVSGTILVFRSSGGEELYRLETAAYHEGVGA